MNMTLQYEKELTLKPKIDKNSELMLLNKHPQRQRGAEGLYLDAQRRNREKSIDA